MLGQGSGHRDLRPLIFSADMLNLMRRGAPPLALAKLLPVSVTFEPCRFEPELSPSRLSHFPNSLQSIQFRCGNSNQERVSSGYDGHQFFGERMGNVSMGQGNRNVGDAEWAREMLITDAQAAGNGGKSALARRHSRSTRVRGRLESAGLTADPLFGRWGSQFRPANYLFI
jgi:hypothetical protein